ncbi:nicotinate-nucleotide--dimethylbenzimidazole phosphoribosyltransferase [Sporomusa acidovorans]|uniref:Nicotinate-nucleotide--dimethylbenzimidazole phosphoribosyltransferase n=1 Tax=Sporomusa acidovorans (strain ATCC 49682 / DSM 3132 / Mol) TaxID=1123286 RepID=A0ABZ3IYV5_SPOA4|nr:nicotinate-nucleotide--dimethylbenzimidazole phosphoribosyltransferase [Sporomusa acidovorans]OZC14154.1 nicotinate-nucleotide--dimethylbenzimidazole phosphoribosyltransferase [Sporomusa acidovorans DSM 3132]SDE69853.1 nicotinate-nucleotide--dimethylbenzimidazole phosphoribosyltransferase [Sporomusa acidovorans]
MNYQTEVDNLVDGAAKPVNSLGLMERILKKMLLAWGTMHPEIKPYHLVFAADNGVFEEGVANFSQEITYLQAQNMVDGHATISCFCQANNVPYSVIDIGINNPKTAGINRRVACGTKNFMKEEAMTPAEFEKAWQIGEEMVGYAIDTKGANLLSFGEMGIGNTTTSSAVLHAMTGILPEFVVGYGAGIHNNEVTKRKCVVVAKGVERHRETFRRIEDILRCVGGLDIVAICAGMMECAKRKTPFVIDGFITAVAFACASRIDRQVEHFGLPSHMSKEPGMSYAMLLGNILAEDIPIRANMALGEGTGAILMIGILKTMIYTMYNMAKLSDFKLSVPEEPQVAGM